MKNGIVLIDKPRGISSAQAIARVKRALNPDRIGHAGTLDPLATGLLVALIGQATRLAQFAEGGMKIYSGIIRLGLTTESDDLDGAVIAERPVRCTEAEILNAASKFIGEIEQLPPRVSAIKVDGVRAYDRVRNNEEVTLKKRPVVIESLELTFLAPNQIHYRVRCSKGTYIRSIARDIGELLGCGGAIEELRRERSEPFSVQQACGLDEVTPDAILPWQLLFPGTPYLELSKQAVTALSGGDQRCLAAPDVVDAAAALKARSSVILYGEGDRGAPSGILLQREGSLQLGLHLPR